MITKKDIVPREIVDLVVPGHEGIKYRLPNGGDEQMWLNKYMTVSEHGVAKVLVGELNKCKLLNVVEIPIEKGLIASVLSSDKDSWSDLDTDERWKFLSDLDDELLSNLILSINEVTQVARLKKKN